MSFNNTFKRIKKKMSFIAKLYLMETCELGSHIAFVTYMTFLKRDNCTKAVVACNINVLSIGEH